MHASPSKIGSDLGPVRQAYPRPFVAGPSASWTPARRPGRTDRGTHHHRRLVPVPGAGFGRTTVDQIADLAHTGKTTLYGRFPTKEALFSAVVLRYVDELQARMAIVPTNGTPKERLVQVGIELANLTLAEESIALMRLTIAEAKAFPELGREGSVSALADASAASRSAWPRTAPTRR